MSTLISTLIGSVVAAVGLLLTYLVWQATVYGREWRAARDRVIEWAVACGEVVQALALPGAQARLAAMDDPPFSYRWRTYGLFLLMDDLALLYDRSSSVSQYWAEPYVDEEVVDPAAVRVKLLTDEWLLVRGAPSLRGVTPMPEEALTQWSAYCLQRLGMVQEFVYRLELRTWLWMALHRRTIHTRQAERVRRRNDRFTAQHQSGAEAFPLLNWVPV